MVTSWLPCGQWVPTPPLAHKALELIVQVSAEKCEGDGLAAERSDMGASPFVAVVDHPHDPESWDNSVT